MKYEYVSVVMWEVYHDWSNNTYWSLLTHMEILLYILFIRINRVYIILIIMPRLYTLWTIIHSPYMYITGRSNRVWCNGVLVYTFFIKVIELYSVYTSKVSNSLYEPIRIKTVSIMLTIIYTSTMVVNFTL